MVVEKYPDPQQFLANVKLNKSRVNYLRNTYYKKPRTKESKYLGLLAKEFGVNESTFKKTLDVWADHLDAMERIIYNIESSLGEPSLLNTKSSPKEEDFWHNFIVQTFNVAKRQNFPELPTVIGTLAERQRPTVVDLSYLFTGFLSKHINDKRLEQFVSLDDEELDSMLKKPSSAPQTPMRRGMSRAINTIYQMVMSMAKTEAERAYRGGD